MLNNLESNVEYVKELGQLIYGKEIFSYDYENDLWYSHYHLRVIELDEALEWIRERVTLCFREKLDCDIEKLKEDRYKYLLKYKNKDSDENWTYHESVNELEIVGMVEKLDLEGNKEYEVFKSLYDAK